MNEQRPYLSISDPEDMMTKKMFKKLKAATVSTVYSFVFVDSESILEGENGRICKYNGRIF